MWARAGRDAPLDWRGRAFRREDSALRTDELLMLHDLVEMAGGPHPAGSAARLSIRYGDALISLPPGSFGSAK